MSEAIVLIGAMLQLFGISAYIRDTLKGKTKPNRMTWLMWSFAPIIGSLAAVSKGVGWSQLPVFMAGFGPLLVVIASFINKNSYWKLQKLDYICGSFSALALVLWMVTGEGNVAILFAILSDATAALPALIKSWNHPETETVLAYILGTIANILGLTIVVNWNFSSVAFSLYLIGVNIMFIFALLRKR